MTYATTSDIRAVFDERELIMLTDDSGAADAINDVKIELALDDATAEINGYLASRLPFATVPNILRVHCRDLARYRLYANKARVSDDIQQLRDASIKYLELVAAGKISLGDEDEGETVSSSPGPAIIEGDAPVMTRDTLKGF